jgi:acetyl-CoA carboxylase biotin carboxyl carrier protein
VGLRASRLVESVTNEHTINSPVPGTFYRAPSPKDEPFVNEGDSVRPGDVVGLVEIMKMFSEVTAENEGVVDRFLVADGDPVDAGQPLVVLSD